MDIVSNITTYTASKAREDLYSLIKSAGKGLKAYEITLRGSEPVMLINKQELESWQETLDILSNKKEISAIRKAGRQKRSISHAQLLKTLDIEHES